MGIILDRVGSLDRMSKCFCDPLISLHPFIYRAYFCVSAENKHLCLCRSLLFPENGIGLAPASPALR